MNTTVSELMEVGFNIFYLVFIYTLVILIFSAYRRIRKGNLIADGNTLSQMKLFQAGFLLLAIGDTGHVGFRVIAYALGNIETTFSLFGSEASLIGIGSLATAITVTFLYMIIARIWQLRFHKKQDTLSSVLFWFLILVGIARTIVMLFPQNRWGATIEEIPYAWSLFRNSLLTVQGLLIAVLILIDAVKAKDRVFEVIAYLIFISYAFYVPVILFVREVPMIGLLMIPKTIAYLVMAYYGYKKLYTGVLKTK